MRISLCVAYCLAAALLAADEPRSLLEAAAHKLDDLDSYTIEFVRHDRTGTQDSVVLRRVSFTRPFRWRIEDLPVPTGQPCPRLVEVIDGTVRLGWAAELKQYWKMKIDPRRESPRSQFALRVPDGLQNVERAADERLSIAGRDHNCHVVRGDIGARVRLTAWIDKSSGIAVKWTISSPATEITTEILSIEPDAALAAALFTFDPPPDWRASPSFRCK